MLKAQCSLIEGLGTRRVVTEGSSSSKLEDQVQALTPMMQEFIVKEKTHQVKACEVYSSNHPIDFCLHLQEEPSEEVKPNGFQGHGFQKRYDPYSNTNNPRWQDQPNFRYGNTSGNQLPPRQYTRPPPPHSRPLEQGATHFQPQSQSQGPSTSMSTENMF